MTLAFFLMVIPHAAPKAQVTAGPAAMARVSVEVERTAGADGIAAVDLLVNGQADSQVLLFPGVASSPAVIGPLRAGRHELSVRPSPLWPWPAGVRVTSVRADTVDTSHADHALLRWAPRIGLRDDTVGTTSDL